MFATPRTGVTTCRDCGTWSTMATRLLIPELWNRDAVRLCSRENPFTPSELLALAYSKQGEPLLEGFNFCKIQNASMLPDRVPLDSSAVSSLTSSRLSRLFVSSPIGARSRTATPKLGATLIKFRSKALGDKHEITTNFYCSFDVGDC
jgi:hypothetical protein